MPLTTTTLAQLRALARQLSDMENTDFVSDSELDYYINLGVKELYDLFAEAHGQEFFLKTFPIATVSDINCYDLPDDFHVLKGVDWRSEPFPSNVVDGVTHWVMPYRLDRVQVLRPYTFFERHRGGDTNRGQASDGPRFRIFTERRSSTVTTPGVCGATPCDVAPSSMAIFNNDGSELRLGILLSPDIGSCVYYHPQDGDPMFIGTVLEVIGGMEINTIIVTIAEGVTDLPAEGTELFSFCPLPPDVDTEVCEYVHRIRFQPVRAAHALVWYMPEHPRLTGEDCGLVGFHGYEEYPAVFAAIRMLRKEESDYSGVAMDLEAMKGRIRNMASNRDMGHPSVATDFTDWTGE